MSDELLEAQYGQLQEVKTPGEPSHGNGEAGTHFCEFYCKKFDQVLTANIEEKPSHASGSGSGKRTTFSEFISTHLILI